MNKILFFIIGFVVFLSCNSPNNNKHIITESDEIIDSPTGSKTSSEIDQINGLWINSEYIEKIKTNYSISTTQSSIFFWISILIKDDSLAEALTTTSLEPTIGRIAKDHFLIADSVYKIKKIDREKILIKSSNTSNFFTKINSSRYINSNDGRDYLNSFLFFGSYKFIDSYINKEILITFKEKNQLIGFSDYIHYYPFSLLGNDIINFVKKDNTRKCFIFKKIEKGFIFSEVEIVDIEDGPVKLTGKEYRLEKIN